MPDYIVIPQVVAVTASTTKTVLQYLAPSTHQARLKSLSVSFDATDATDIPPRVDLLRQTSAGTMTAGTLTPVDPGTEAAQGSTSNNATAEPTAGAVLASWYVTSIGGLWAWQFPLGDEIIIPASNRIGIRVVTQALVSPNCIANMTISE